MPFHSEFLVAFEANSVPETFYGLQEVQPDVCILEISMVRHSWLGFVREVTRQARDIGSRQLFWPVGVNYLGQ